MALTNRRNQVGSAFLVNEIWFKLMKLVEFAKHILKSIRRIAKSQLEKSAVAKRGCNYYHRMKWSEATVLAADNPNVPAKSGHQSKLKNVTIIGQEGKPLDSTWRVFIMLN